MGSATSSRSATHKGGSNSFCCNTDDTDKAREDRRRVATSRCLFLAGLIIVAILLGLGAFRLLSESEKHLAREQFEAISDRALDRALEITLRKRFAAQSLATSVAYAFPNASQWPNVNMHGFEHIAKSVINTASATTMGLAVKVQPGQEFDSFQDYMYNVAFPQNNYSSDTGIYPDFEQGVYGFTANNEPYLETNGSTYWNSPYKAVWPFSMHSAAPLLLMMNLHSLESFGRVIDEVQACVDSRKLQNNTSTLDLTQCAILSDFMIMYRADKRTTGPSAVIMQPIYPAHDPNELVGLITSTMKWEDALNNLFSSQVDGVDCVMETETQAYTYHITGGVATLRGSSDLHDKDYTHLGQTIDLYSPGLFSYSSAKYTLSLYPSDAFFQVYRTTNPVTALIGALCIIVFTSALFFLYDFFVRQEFLHKQAVANAKRQYIRYISHCLRTPLNAVVMGSQLVQDDMSSFFRSKAIKKQKQQQSNGNSNRNSVNDDQHSTEVTVMNELQEKLTDWSGLTGEILQNTQSAVTVLNDLLNYDKVNSGEMKLDLTIIPIWCLIKRTVSEFNLSAAVIGIDLVVDFRDLLAAKPSGTPDSESEPDSGAEEKTDPELGNFRVADLPHHIQEQRVIGDPVRIASVLRHFLSNAIKFTPQGGNINVRLSIQQPGSTSENETFTLHHGVTVSFSKSGILRVDVIDSGRGLTRNQVQNVLHEGVQFNVNKMHAGQGSGLGLFISRGIAKQHGGTLSCASEGPGQGSTFSLTLPLYHIAETELPENIRHLRAFRGDMERLPVGTFRILVVDDVATNRKLLIRLLKHRGHVCDEAEDGDRAVALMKEAIEAGDPYSVVLLDYEMPIMDGPTAAHEMRKLGCGSFIVGVTCKILEEDVVFFKSQGANTVLPKPINIRDLEELWAEYGVSARQKDSSVTLRLSRPGEIDTPCTH